MNFIFITSPYLKTESLKKVKNSIKKKKIKTMYCWCGGWCPVAHDVPTILWFLRTVHCGNQCAKTTAYSAHHEPWDTNLHASKRFYLPCVSTWLLFTLRRSSLPHTYISPPYMFPCSTEGTWSSVPRSTQPPATRLCLSRRWPTHNNAPVYCKSTSSPDSEIHASKILIVLLLDIYK